MWRPAIRRARTDWRCSPARRSARATRRPAAGHGRHRPRWPDRRAKQCSAHRQRISRRRWFRLPRHWCGNAARWRSRHRQGRGRSRGQSAERRRLSGQHAGSWRECWRRATWRRSTVAPRDRAIKRAAFGAILSLPPCGVSRVLPLLRQGQHGSPCDPQHQQGRDQTCGAAGDERRQIAAGGIAHHATAECCARRRFDGRRQSRRRSPAPSFLPNTSLVSATWAAP